ncbi:hypothetical protein OG948_39570 (plasmid) [Embleya sp. NBC_00888]|uniref:hypothetical protein n=1 Tax=Embleya sp. NBC_00888 TaxID=2975960 RepID=UPI002F90C56C|nr:hypothetical protein OG948_39570 [Embleya sp. NBC_00888]
MASSTLMWPAPTSSPAACPRAITADGNRIAARFTIHALMRKRGPVTTRVHMFAEFTAEGLLRWAEQLTRTIDLPEPQHGK